MTYLEAAERVTCDMCGWNLQADNNTEADVLLEVHLSVVLEDSLKTGYVHTHEGRAQWLKERTK